MVAFFEVVLFANFFPHPLNTTFCHCKTNRSSAWTDRFIWHRRPGCPGSEFPLQCWKSFLPVFWKNLATDASLSGWVYVLSRGLECRGVPSPNLYSRTSEDMLSLQYWWFWLKGHLIRSVGQCSKGGIHRPSGWKKKPCHSWRVGALSTAGCQSPDLAQTSNWVRSS